MPCRLYLVNCLANYSSYLIPRFYPLQFASFSSVHIVGSLISKFPSINYADALQGAYARSDLIAMGSDQHVAAAANTCIV